LLLIGDKDRRHDYHKRCNVFHHSGFGMQQQTCRHCIQHVVDLCYAAGMSHDDSFQQVLLVARCYWCPFCIKDSFETGRTPSSITLKLFRSCATHRPDFLRKSCPCGLAWTNCLKCMDDCVDPRAGMSFCRTCRKRRGPAGPRRCDCGRPAALVISDEADAHMAADDYISALE